ncbi:tRNA adenosine deaminase-associated protein [Enemella sp. A6]|uniref:tRNA adenosine deaminase-associated protein n=1 Tax=Enemella sp. A6 TaxID=3440152 RepID=UPI003EBB2E8F
MSSFEPDDEYVSFDLDDDDNDDDDYDDLDDLEDASEDDIDFCVAVYREEGELVAAALPTETANDLDELIAQLLRLPGEAGSIGFVSLVDEVFIAVRVRGRKVQVLLSDGLASEDWPLARDVLDYLGTDLDDDIDDDEVEPVGDLEIFADLGVSDFDVEALIDALDDSSEQVFTIVDRIGFGAQVRRVVEAEF